MLECVDVVGVLEGSEFTVSSCLGAEKGGAADGKDVELQNCFYEL